MLLRTIALTTVVLLVTACDEDVEDARDLPEEVRAEWEAFDAEGADQLRITSRPANCRQPRATVGESCWVLPEIGETFCSPGAPVNVVETEDGIVLDIDMSGRTAMGVDTIYLEAEGWLFHLANAAGAVGDGGDDPTSSQDAEAQLKDTTLQVYGSERGGRALLIDEPMAIDATQDRSTMLVCEGFYGFRSGQGAFSANDPALFQFGGDEPDRQAGGTNDSMLHLAFERTVSGSGPQGLEGDGVPLARIRISP